MQKTIQSKLFVNYISVFAIIIIVFFLLFYVYTSNMLEDSASDSIIQLANVISQQIDVELDKMNTIQKKILFSDDIKNLIPNGTKNINEDSLVLQRKYNNLINLVSGPDDFHKYQTNIYYLQGPIVGIGQNCFIDSMNPVDILNTRWVRESLSLNGKKLITPPQTLMWFRNETTVISMFRALSLDNTTELSAVLEIQMDYTILNNIIDSTINIPHSLTNNDKKIVITDANNNLIYPIYKKASDTPLEFYKKKLKLKGKKETAINIKNTYTGSKEILTAKHSQFSGWTVMVIQPQDSFLKPIVNFRITLILLGTAAILLIMVITYFITRNLSQPIKRIHRSLKNLRLDTLPVNLPQNLGSDIIEFEDLNNVFLEMCNKLKISLDDLVLARSHEIQARLLAVQAQMNPHFLYNTLSTIKIMGKEAGNDNIVQVCSDLSKMLRYISDPSNKPVNLSAELEHTNSYLNLMKVRYQDKLLFTLDIPNEMLNIQVPRLILQPLAENCIKYGINVYPPWIIKIHGEIRDGLWYIKVIDNGTGFEESNLLKLKNMFENFNSSSDNIPVEINGMGIINIFVRLKLLYNEHAIFNIEHAPEGGAIVTIGGPFTYDN